MRRMFRTLLASMWLERCPRSMDLIIAEDVIRAVEVYFAGGAIDHLTPDEVRNIAELDVEEAQ